MLDFRFAPQNKSRSFSRSRIDWGFVALVSVMILFGTTMIGMVRGQYSQVDAADIHPSNQQPFENLARVELSVEDAERLASMLIEEAKLTRDERLEALEARVAELEASR